MFIGTIIFVIGTPRYRVHAVQKTDPICSVVKVFVAAYKNRKLNLPENLKQLYEIPYAQDVDFLPHTDTFRFLDKAAIQQSGEQNSGLCRVSQVEATKIILSMIPIFLSTIITSICLTDFLNYSINQGITMDYYLNNLEVPATPFLGYLFMAFLIPLYHYVFVPFARKFTGLSTGITHLQRVSSGIVFSIIAMIAGAILEVKRKNVAESHNMVDAIPLQELLPISFFWLSFQYFFYGISQVLIFVGLLEFFYSEAPRGLKSSATCFLWISTAIGYFMSNVVVDWVNDATENNTATGGWLVGFNINRNHVNYFYWMLAVLSFINLLIFMLWARWYKYRSQNSKVRVTDENVAV
ncbi:protein NRT1/ PTR FAMILY 4.6-like [Asparagus officinalis]|uniref:protein NRT1/ PTR FAMILY 4.6-like n=1 Tax=Asparagus officinalis TaxID=4686 RepID=UPI00098DED1D|nr:protein NRT1/ PTR FAMILY 4.6-like [Asparagus officinalis]